MWQRLNYLVAPGKGTYFNGRYKTENRCRLYLSEWITYLKVLNWKFYQVSKDKTWLDTCLKDASKSIQKCLSLIEGKIFFHIYYLSNIRLLGRFGLRAHLLKLCGFLNILFAHFQNFTKIKTFKNCHVLISLIFRT